MIRFSPVHPIGSSIHPGLADDDVPIGQAGTQFPASGQTTSSVVGDDGDVEAGALRYVDNGDGTITDLNTGLIWEKKVKLDSTLDAANLHDADNRYPWRGSCSTAATECGTDADCPGVETCDAGDSQTSSPNGLTIFEVVAALNQAAFAGHSDWRVPNVKELQSIVDYEVFTPSVDATFQGASCGGACTDLTDPACSCTASSAYWSASPGAFNPTGAWGVGFNFGLVIFGNRSGLSFVRAVRGGP